MNILKRLYIWFWSQSPQIGSWFQFKGGRNEKIYNNFQSQSPQIGSWFQFNRTHLQYISEGAIGSQSPQIGSWFQSNKQLTSEVDRLRGEVSIPSDRVLVSMLIVFRMKDL